MNDERSTPDDRERDPAGGHGQDRGGATVAAGDSADAPVPEELWGGAFGDAYVERNASVDERRAAFWRDLLDDLRSSTVLEVGCGQGGNIGPLSRLLSPDQVWGVDVNTTALARARANAPGTHLSQASARALPFPDRSFDLVFTMGVLIHQPDDLLPAVMDEIVRVADRFVLAGEYHADETVALDYRGVQGALFKRDYGRLYLERYPSLTLRRSGFLDQDAGFDRLTVSVLERRADG
ncbi:MAG: pseudaminic acid biosynthesis-associated methylase [Candidatus Limnocylindrales bacterium]